VTGRWRSTSGIADVGEPAAAGAGCGGRAALASQGRGRGEAQAHRPSAAGAGDAAGRRLGGLGVNEDQCWTLARIAEVASRQFGVNYTLAGMDLLLHRSAAACRSRPPGRRA
jgi:hypothetical protein